MKQESFFLRDQVGKMYLAFQSDGIYCQALKKKKKTCKVLNLIFVILERSPRILGLSQSLWPFIFRLEWNWCCYLFLLTKKLSPRPHQEGPKGNSESKSYAGSLILVKYSFSYLWNQSLCEYLSTAHNLLIVYAVLILVTGKWMCLIMKAVKNDCVILFGG